MKIRNIAIPVGVIAIWAFWLYLIFANARGDVAIFDQENLGKLGTFGDSFGAVASLMATLAAAGAFLTFLDQRENTKKQLFETNFYTLLSHFQQIVASMDVDSVRKTRKRLPNGKFEIVSEHRRYEGSDAIRRMMEIFRNTLNKDDFKDTKIIHRKYCAFYEKWSNDLGHYSRLLYHIFRMVDERCPSEKEYYTRIVRAHLSSAEISLLGYNVVCGEGRDKFIEYVRKYALLHNIHRSETDDILKAEVGFFQRKIGNNAFRFRELGPLNYNDI